jgi:post-segregation antitoxin (ccd killing protein)
MHMTRINIYLPDSLAKEAKAADLNLSRVTQEALRLALGTERTNAWLGSVAALGTTDVSHEDVLQAVHDAKSDLVE